MSCIKVLGIEMDIDCKYTRGAAGRQYDCYGDPGEPPEPDSIDIKAVYVGGQDITELIEKADLWKAIEDEIRE